MLFLHDRGKAASSPAAGIFPAHRGRCYPTGSRGLSQFLGAVYGAERNRKADRRDPKEVTWGRRVLKLWDRDSAYLTPIPSAHSKAPSWGRRATQNSLEMKSLLKCFAERGRAAALWGLGAPQALRGSAPLPLTTRQRARAEPSRSWAGRRLRAGRGAACAPPSGCWEPPV